MGKYDRRRDADPAAAGHRHQRLQHIIHEELNALLRDEIADPGLHDVWLTSVELSVDYGHARVRFLSGTPGAAARQQAEQALGRATGFLRARLAGALEIKRVPQLRFLWDDVRAGTEEDRCG